MSEAQKDLEQAIGGVLKNLSYAKRGATWHRDRDAVILVLNLQKSQWGDDRYLNLGVYLKKLGDEVRPAEARCHVRCRASSGMGGVAPRDPVALAALVSEVAVPWLDRLGSEEGVAGFLASEASAHCFVHRSVRETLGAGPRVPTA